MVSTIVVDSAMAPMPKVLQANIFEMGGISMKPQDFKIAI
jgi:hypothetical protein